MHVVFQAANSIIQTEKKNGSYFCKRWIQFFIFHVNNSKPMIHWKPWGWSDSILFFLSLIYSIDCRNLFSLRIYLSLWTHFIHRNSHCMWRKYIYFPAYKIRDLFILSRYVFISLLPALCANSFFFNLHWYYFFFILMERKRREKKKIMGNVNIYL